MRLVFIAILLAFAFGCASVGETYKPRESVSRDKALVYVFRPSDYECQKGPIKSADPNFLFINDTRVFAFSCNTYTVLELDPGAYRFSIKKNVFYLPAYEKNGAQKYVFGAGTTYYIRYTEDFAFTDTATGRSISITNSTFEKTEGPATPAELPQMRYVTSSTQSFK